MTNNSWILDFSKKLNVNNTENKVFSYTGYTMPEGYEEYVYINTMNMVKNEETSPKSVEHYGHIIHLHVDPLCDESFKIVLTAKCTDNTDSTNTVSNSYEFDYMPSILPLMENSDSVRNMSGRNISYQLLRTNPKLTGNLKVVVDSSSNIFIDTFKVSKALSQYKYRHIAVNSNEYYGKSIMTKFNKMPSDDLYKVEDRCYDIFSTVNDYKNQYYDIYDGGVRTNSDKLYSENFAILAPLCIKEILPDFFLVFKVKTDDFNNTVFTNEAEKAKYFFSKGTLVKSYDMRKDSELGKYIRKVYDQSKKYPGDIFAAYDKNNYNKFIGISIDRGVVTSAYETVHDQASINNQVALNEYFTKGFERNKLISKNILNFEFMFNDVDEKLFSLNTYFGIYVRLNGEASDFSCIGFDENKGTYIYDASIHSFEPGTDIDNIYPEIIYGVSTPMEFIRLKESFIASSINEKFMLKPYKTLVNGELRSKENAAYREFITITINSPLEVGEHLRIIDLEDTTIYDVLLTNRSEYLDIQGISDITYNYIQHDGIIYTEKRISAFSAYSDAAVTPDEIDTAISDQITHIFNAFRKFNDSKIMTAVKKTKNSIAFVCTGKNCVFERVSGFADYDIDNMNAISNYDDSDRLSFYGFMQPEKLILDLRTDNLYDRCDLLRSEYFYLYPGYTSGVGNRIVYAANFIHDDLTEYMLSAKNIKELDNKSAVYMDANKDYALYTPFNLVKFEQINGIITETAIETKYILSEYLDDTYMLNLKNPYLASDRYSLYEVFPINTGICSILNINDFDFEVLDNKSMPSYRSDSIIGNPGEFTKNTLYGAPLRNTLDKEEIFIDYIDSHRVLFDNAKIKVEHEHDEATIEYSNLQTPANKDKYYNSLITENHIYSDIALTCPYVCKWRSNGTDARGENMRIMYDYRSDLRSYYVPYDSAIFSTNVERGSGFMDFPGFIQASNTLQNYPKIVKRSLQDLIAATMEHAGTSLYDAIIKGNLHIETLAFDNNGKCKMSEVYISGNNAIEFISGGIKIRIASSNNDIINFNSFIGYEGILITVPGINTVHSVPTELIIDEENKQLALIWYQGSSSLLPDEEELGIQQGYYTFRLYHTSPMYDSKCMRIGETPYLATPNDGSIDGTSLFFQDGYFIEETENFSDYSGFTSQNRVSIISKLSQNEIDTRDGFFISENPYLLCNDTQMEATDNNILTTTETYKNAVNLFVLTDKQDAASYVSPKLSNFKKDLNTYGVSVKTEYGYKDYTYVNNLLSFTIVSPYTVKIDNDFNAYVHTTYGEPKMTKITKFESSDAYLDSIFEKSFEGANIIISDIEKLTQKWISKYTTSIDYCIPLDSSYPRISIDNINGVSLFENCWGPIFRNYYITTDYDDNGMAYPIEKTQNIMGYETGYEIPRFFNSRGLNLNGKDGSTLVIDRWKNTKILLKEKCIKLDVTESIILNILFKEGFSDAWRYLNMNSNTYKIRYIKNYVMNFININNMTKFELFKNPKSYNMYFRDGAAESESYESADNIKHELHYENGKYFMYIYPEIPHVYYAKMTIEL